MIKWTLISLAVLAAIVAAVVVAGWLLPVAHVASQRIEFAAPPRACGRRLPTSTRSRSGVPT